MPWQVRAQGSGFSFVGPGGGGAQFFPAVNPRDDKNIFVACDMGGAYVTYDRGEHWHMFTLLNAVRGYSFDPADTATVYAVATGLFRSRDKGRTWALVFPDSSRIAAIVPQGDHASEVLVTRDSAVLSVVCAAVDPADGTQLRMIARENGKLFLFGSDDRGGTWRREKDLPDGCRYLFADPLSPADNRTWYVAGSPGFWQYANGQWLALPLPAAVTGLRDCAAGVDSATHRFLLYALATVKNDSPENSRLLVSRNGGKDWIDLTGRLAAGAKPRFNTLAVCAAHAKTVYVSYAGLPAADGTPGAGVARSDDGGDHWRLCWQDVGERAAANFSRDWLNERFGPGWGENPLCLGVAPQDPNFCVATDLGRTVLTTDGGKSWQQVYARQAGRGWQTRGLEVTTNYDIVRDPFDKKHEFILYTDIGLFESFDAGESWQSATDGRGIPAKWVNTCYALVFDPASKGRAWAAMSGVHDLPRPKMFRRHGIRDFNGGLLRTENGGKTWTIAATPAGEAAFTDILLDKNSPPGARILYACAFGKGVCKSFDGGKTWVYKNRGIEGKEPFAWHLAQGESGDLYLVVSRRSEDGRIGTEQDGALYRSTDHAETWQKIPLPENSNGPTSLVARGDLLLLSAWGRPAPGIASPDQGGGIYRSADRGRTWQPVLTTDQHIHDITYDARTNRYYACGFEGAAYYSADRGDHWTRLCGYDFKWGKKVVPDFDDPEKVYILTFGGGVWRGPATNGTPCHTPDPNVVR